MSMRPNETTNQALARLGFVHAQHSPGDKTCDMLRGGPGRPALACTGRHIERVSDGVIVAALGCLGLHSRREGGGVPAADLTSRSRGIIMILAVASWSVWSSGVTMKARELPLPGLRTFWKVIVIR